jgi:hypothetical protein
MCPYETVCSPAHGFLSWLPTKLTVCQVAYGFSRFCELFTYEEWIGFGYSVDLSFYGNDAFGSPTGVSDAIRPHFGSMPKAY